MASSTSTTSKSLAKFPSFSRTKTFHSNTIISNFITFPSSTKFPLCFASYNSTTNLRYNEVVVDEEVDKIRMLQNSSDVRGVALDGLKKRRTINLLPPAIEAIVQSFGEEEIGHGLTTLLPSFMRDASKLMACISNKLNTIQDFRIKVLGLATQVGALWAIVAEPAFGVTGMNDEEDLIWVLIQLGISAFVYFIVVPPIIMNWLRIRWYKRNLLEMYLQFMFVFLFFPGLMLWAPFLNFRKFPRDPSMKYPWSTPQDPSQIRGGFLKYPWAQPEDYE